MQQRKRRRRPQEERRRKEEEEEQGGPLPWKTQFSSSYRYVRSSSYLSQPFSHNDSLLTPFPCSVCKHTHINNTGPLCPLTNFRKEISRHHAFLSNSHRTFRRTSDLTGTVDLLYHLHLFCLHTYHPTHTPYLSPDPIRKPKTRTQEQKDVNEFCNLLFDKLESLDPKIDQLLKGLFGGVQVGSCLSVSCCFTFLLTLSTYLPTNPTVIQSLTYLPTYLQVYQNISRECAHRSERTEPFTMLTAEVKNKSSLEDSLELYVAGELLAGDNKYACRSVVSLLAAASPSLYLRSFSCVIIIVTSHLLSSSHSECGSKVEALRRTAIKTLPPILIIHLKRFEFDLETMTKFKVGR